MKKMIIALVIVCLLIGGAIGFLNSRAEKAGVIGAAESPADVLLSETQGDQAAPVGAAAADPATETVPDAAEEETFTVRVPDYAAMYALHEPDEIVARVGGQEVTWGEYFYLYFSQAKQMENTFNTMLAYYGAAPDWADQVEEDSDATFADMVAESAGETLKQICAIEGVSERAGVELTDEQLEEIRAQEEQDIIGAVGEGKTEEDFNAYIATIFLPRSLYDRMNRVNFLYRQGFIQTYGEQGELMEDDVAIQYLVDKEYMAATHILLMTIDPATFEEMDEDTKAEKLQQAQEIADELRAIEDKDERLKRFAEIKAERCEDTGKTAFPDGYTFLPGAMVPEFEEGVLGLEEYEVSDPIKTDYGYHVIMRLPLDPDSVIEYSNDGTPLTARSKAANDAYGTTLQDYFNSLTVEYVEGFEPPKLLDYLQ